MTYSIIPDYKYDVKNVSNWKLMPEDYEESELVGGRYRSRFVTYLERNIKTDKMKMDAVDGVTDEERNVPLVKLSAKGLADSDGPVVQLPAITWKPVKVPAGSRIPVAIPPTIRRLPTGTTPNVVMVFGCNSRTISASKVACDDDDVHAIGCQGDRPAVNQSCSSSLQSCWVTSESADVRDHGNGDTATYNLRDRSLYTDAPAVMVGVSASNNEQKFRSSITTDVFDKYYGCVNYEKYNGFGENRSANDSPDHTDTIDTASVKPQQSSVTRRKYLPHEQQIVDTYGQKVVLPSVVPGKHRASSGINRKNVNKETERINNIIRKKLLSVKSTLPKFR